jgi:succinate dehydrogenase / fumarate reductase cytochrome b subunit
MAITGLVLVGFVVAHLIGNLQIFIGREAINRYGHFLQTTPELVWPARLFLLAMIVLHIFAAIALTRENRAARPIPYAHYEVVAASYASRTMFMSGLIVLVFIVYHLLHFTVQVPQINLTGQDFRLLEDSKQRHDIFGMMVTGYRNPLVSGFYLLGVGLLSLHLSHGISSLFQSLGLSNRIYMRFFEKLAKLLAIAIFIGYASIPAAVLMGVVK